MNFPILIRVPATRHSEKPGAFYEAIEAAFPNYSKLELFARNPRDGWDSWGNDV